MLLCPWSEPAGTLEGGVSHVFQLVFWAVNLQSIGLPAAPQHPPQRCFIKSGAGEFASMCAAPAAAGVNPWRGTRYGMEPYL